jgi:phage terminase large subunit-like protein
VRLEPGILIATGTPKAGHGLVKRLLFGDKDHGIPPADYITRMRMEDNLANLSPSIIERLKARYEGSTLGRQELEGEYLEDVEGALWTAALIARNRIQHSGPMTRIVVAVDPPGGATEAGIVAAGVTSRCVCGRSGVHAYVLADDSHKGSPDQWGTTAVNLYDQLGADRVVGEVNYGGDMVENVVRSVRASIPFSPVRATRGKAIRAEPVLALYEQGRIHHVGTFGDLESEMTTWTPDAVWSPNRLDALVWAITELGLTENREASTGFRTLTEARMR